MVLRLYNTLTERKEEFKPLAESTVKMFVCGPTVYDYIHLGHARTFTFYDMLARLLTYKGNNIKFVMNITDLDDKVFAKAREEGTSFTSVSEKFISEFLYDLKALNVNAVTNFAKASDFVQESIRQMVELVKKGYAYAVDGTVFYDTSNFKDYGKLSHQTSTDLKLRRLDLDPRKKNQSDYLLWRPSAPDEPRWDTPYGSGRPGWHIEDTAISIKLLGERYDIHGGAQDLVFPHHEAEIAQAEALTGRKPFVNHWIHMGMLHIRGEKMSKSLKNYITVKDALKKYPVDSLKLYFYSHKYRNTMDFDPSEMRSASKIASKISKAATKLRHHLRRPSKSEGTRTDWKQFERRFYTAVDNDLNTPKAVVALTDFADWINRKLDGNISQTSFTSILNSFLGMCWILGLSYVDDFKFSIKQGAA